jgi:hypothetical protein
MTRGGPTSLRSSAADKEGVTPKRIVAVERLVRQSRQHVRTPPARASQSSNDSDPRHLLL